MDRKSPISPSGNFPSATPTSSPSTPTTPPTTPPTGRPRSRSEPAISVGATRSAQAPPHAKPIAPTAGEPGTDLRQRDVKAMASAPALPDALDAVALDPALERLFTQSAQAELTQIEQRDGFAAIALRLHLPTEPARCNAVFRAVLAQGERLLPSDLRVLCECLGTVMGRRAMPLEVRRACLDALVDGSQRPADNRDEPLLDARSLSACVEGLFGASGLGLDTATPALRRACLDDLIAAIGRHPIERLGSDTVSGLVDGLGRAMAMDDASGTLNEELFNGIVDAAAASRLGPQACAGAIEGLVQVLYGGEVSNDVRDWLIGRIVACAPRVGALHFAAMVGGFTIALGGTFLSPGTVGWLCQQLLAAAPVLPGAHLANALEALGETTGNAQESHHRPVLLPALLRQVMRALPQIAPAWRDQVVRSVIMGYHPGVMSQAGLEASIREFAWSLPQMPLEAVAAAVDGCLQACGWEPRPPHAPQAAAARARLLQSIVEQSINFAQSSAVALVPRLLEGLGGSQITPEDREAVMQGTLACAPYLSPSAFFQVVASFGNALGGRHMGAVARNWMFGRLLAPGTGAMNLERQTAWMMGLTQAACGSLPLGELPAQALLARLQALPADTDRSRVTQLMMGFCEALGVAHDKRARAWVASHLRGSREGPEGLRRLDLATGLDRMAHRAAALGGDGLDLAAHRRRVADILAGDPQEALADDPPLPDGKHTPDDSRDDRDHRERRNSLPPGTPDTL